MRFSLMFCLLACLLFVGTVAAQEEMRQWVDNTGKFRVEAELIAVRKDSVVLEKENGKIIRIPVAKLSDSDQAYLESLSEPAEKPTENRIVRADDASLAAKTKAIFEKACHRCHGEDGTSEGGFNFVTDLDKLSKTMAVPGEDSLIVERITDDEDSIMPPAGEDPALTREEIETINAWIRAGSPIADTQPKRAFITNNDVVSVILEDIRGTSERSQRFKRYFTLTHLHNAGVSEDELQTYRNAFVKLINSLSWNTELIIPKAIDKAETVYGIDIRDLHWNSDIWNSIEEANPYFLNLKTKAADICADKTDTEMPFVRIDWFVFAASKPPLYHSVLNLPDSDSELENMLRVNVRANIDQETAIRAGFNRSGVSQNNRLIEWHKSPYGSYWKSYDFGSNTGQQNLFDYPMGPNDSSNSFREDGGEIIFTLPNGLQGYLLVDENGGRIDQGPTNIVSDPRQPDRTVTNGVSCMSCHYAGVIPKKDEIGIAVRANRDAFDEAEDILALYRESEELDEQFDRDAKRFAEVLSKLGISHISRSGESVSAMAMRFQQDIDLDHVAAEFGLEPEDFLRRLENTTGVARIFSPLLIKGGTIKRDVFKDTFGSACVELRVGAGTSRNRIARKSRDRSRGSRSRAQRSRSDIDYDKINQVAMFDDLRWGAKTLAISPDSRFLVIGKTSSVIMVLDIANNSIAAQIENLRILNSVAAISFSDDGSMVVVGGSSGHVLVFGFNRNGQLKPKGQFAGHSDDVTCMSISNDGKFVLTGGNEKKARYWEVKSGKEITHLSGFKGKIQCVNICPDGKRIQATDGASFIEYDLDKQQVVFQRPLNRSWASGQASAISRDGKFVAAGDSYNINVWQTDTGRKIAELEGNEIQWSMKFTPDGKRLLSGASGKINVWDVQAQQRTHAQPAGEYYVQDLGVSSDGRTFANAASVGNPLIVFQFGE